MHPRNNHFAISYACILSINYLNAIYSLCLRYLPKVYLLPKYYRENIYRNYIPVVPHKAVAEVSKIGNL